MERSTSMDEELLEEAIRCIIDAEGNKFTAIKDLCERKGISHEEAIDYIDIAYDEIQQAEQPQPEPTPEKEVGFFEGRQIDYTRIVSQESNKSVGSTIARGAIGGLVAGPVGMLVGGMTGKNINHTTFLIVYKNGKQKIVTVEDNSDEFKKYCHYLVD